MRDMQFERAGLLAKKRLGKNQKARLAALSAHLQATLYYQPPATPPRPNTGKRGDYQGNTYETHRGGYQTLREMRRAKRFGRAGVKPMRSRIQRGYRRQRTGGVK